MGIVLDRTKRFCGYLVGFVFFISGILKLLDPVGAGLVVDEYYKFMHLDFLQFSSPYMALAFALAETFIGILLVTGLWRRVTAVLTLAFLAFFTLLTLALVIFNPVMDCGCFGEAIHLTHLETFLKNIVLLGLSCAAFFPFSALGVPRRRKLVPFALVTVAVLAFTVYSILYIPLVDFTDFRSSSRLAASSPSYGMADAHQFKSVFIYSKDGVEEEFTLDALPDSTWTYVDTRTEKVGTSSKDETLLSLPVIDASGAYHDELAAHGNVMVFSIHAPEKMSERRWRKLAAYVQQIRTEGMIPLVLLAADPGSWSEKLSELGISAFYSDFKTLVSLNRSNGGATLFMDGFLIRKWASVHLPETEGMQDMSSADATDVLLSYETNGPLTFQAFLLFVFAVMLLL